MDYPFKTTPFPHQLEAFEKTRDMKFYGIFWEQRCGKSKVMVDTAAYLFLEGKIDAMLIVAPPGVQLNWILDEIPTHLPDVVMAKTRMHCYSSPRARTQWHKAEMAALMTHEGLSVLAMSFQAFMTLGDTKPVEGQKRKFLGGKDYVWKFLKKRKCFYIIDESHHIKSPDTKRVMSITASGKYAAYRRILTGTPASEGPFDLFAQIRFLDENFWKFRGMGTFQAFKVHYGEFINQTVWNPKKKKAQDYPLLTKYRNMKELKELVATVSHRVTQDQVLKLPPAIYQKRYFEMTPRQAALYKQLRDEYEVELESGVFITAPLAIVRYGRLQQVASGYLPDDSGEPRSVLEPGAKDPRMEVLEDEIAATSGQFVIFCAYKLDVKRILAFLGDQALPYDGSVTSEQGAVNKARFKAGEVRGLVGTYSKMCEGHNLATAHTMFMYSHTIKAVQRSQAEERIKEPNQTQARAYLDIIGRHTVDEKIVKALREKRDVASQITGDTLKEWL